MTKNKHAKRGGWNQAPDYTPQGKYWRDQLVVIGLIAVFILVALIVGLKS